MPPIRRDASATDPAPIRPASYRRRQPSRASERWRQPEQGSPRCRDPPTCRHLAMPPAWPPLPSVASSGAGASPRTSPPPGGGASPRASPPPGARASPHASLRLVQEPLRSPTRRLVQELPRAPSRRRAPEIRLGHDPRLLSPPLDGPHRQSSTTSTIVSPTTMAPPPKFLPIRRQRNEDGVTCNKMQVMNSSHTHY